MIYLGLEVIYTVNKISTKCEIFCYELVILFGPSQTRVVSKKKEDLNKE